MSSNGGKWPAFLSARIQFPVPKVAPWRDQFWLPEGRGHSFAVWKCRPGLLGFPPVPIASEKRAWEEAWAIQGLLTFSERVLSRGHAAPLLLFAWFPMSAPNGESGPLCFLKAGVGGGGERGRQRGHPKPPFSPLRRRGPVTLPTSIYLQAECPDHLLTSVLSCCLCDSISNCHKV